MEGPGGSLNNTKLTLKNLKTRLIVLGLLLTAIVGRAVPAPEPPKFDEVFQLLTSNLSGVNPADLDHAAVMGLVNQFPGRVLLDVSNAPGAAVSNGLAKVAVYDDACAYFRIGSVEGGLAENFRAAFDDILHTNKTKIKGIILDLRFAGGTDYAAAAAMADGFANADLPLLDWGTGSARATVKTNAITLPVAILVNNETAGAAEGLAAALREEGVGLSLGSTTAGRADIFKDFPLTNGDKLRIAVAQVKLGDGTILAHGLEPDIPVEASLADERAWLEDPYQVLHLPPPPKDLSGTNSAASTNQMPHRPTNEAELVREHASGEPADALEDDSQAPPATPTPPIIADATLARALDLLKGLAVLQQSRPG
jgi:hypothetical protein